MTNRTYTAAELAAAIVASLSLQERVERLERLVAELAGGNSRRARAAYVPFSQKAMLTKKEAAASLSISVSSLEILIAKGEIKTRRFGKRVLIPGTEVDRMTKRDFPTLWPKKKNGRTVRQ